MVLLEDIEPLIGKKCTELGFELFEARFFRAGSRSILRIFIDAAKGITIADCECVSHALSAMLDTENFLNGGQYTLEVSSPGIDRPLKTEKDFRRSCGKEVIVYIKESGDKTSNRTGIVESCERGILRLSCTGTTVELPLETVISGKEQIRFK